MATDCAKRRVRRRQREPRVAVGAHGRPRGEAERRLARGRQAEREMERLRRPRAGGAAQRRDDQVAPAGRTGRRS